MDNRIAAFHNAVSKGKRGDVIRTLAGAGPVAQQSGKWKPYIDDIKLRAASVIDAVVFFGGEYSYWLFLAFFSVILYTLWTKYAIFSYTALGRKEL